MWVPYVTGTPKMSQIGPLIYGITHHFSSYAKVLDIHPTVLGQLPMRTTVNAVIFARLIFRVSQLKNIFGGC